MIFHIFILKNNNNNPINDEVDTKIVNYNLYFILKIYVCRNF